MNIMQLLPALIAVIVSVFVTCGLFCTCIVLCAVSRDRLATHLNRQIRELREVVGVHVGNISNSNGLAVGDGNRASVETS